MPREINPWPDADPDPVAPAFSAPSEVRRPYAELTVDEMLADDEERAGLGARLDAIRHTVTDGGVSLTVDLYGKLLDLTLDQRAMRMRATDLAAHLHRLTTQATTAAQADGTATLADAGLTVPTVPAAG